VAIYVLKFFNTIRVFVPEIGIGLMKLESRDHPSNEAIVRECLGTF